MPVIVSVMLAIASLVTVIAVGKIWLELFQDIFFLYSPPRIFWVFNVFLKKSDKIKLFTFFLIVLMKYFCIACILCGLPFLQGTFNLIYIDKNWFLKDIDFYKPGAIQG